MQTFTKCASLGRDSSYSIGSNLLLALITFLIPVISTAQSSSIRDYVILGGDSTCIVPSNCGVSLGATNVILGGNIGSHTNISTLWSFTLQGEIYSRNETHIFTDAQVNGNIWCANAKSTSRSALSVGHRANLVGNLFVNGNIKIQPGSVNGQVSHPTGTQYNGPIPQGGEVLSKPVFAPLPKYPIVNSFPPSGSTSIYKSAIITPGDYDSIALNGINELVFSGVGDYVFSTIKNSGYKNVFTFDFQNAPTGSIRLLIHGDVDLGKCEVNIINGGDASRIYAETHGTGSSSSDGQTAWYQGPGWIGQNKYSEWKGTVWAPFGAIKIGSGTSQAFVTGALFSQHSINLKNGVTLQHAPFSFCDTSFVININTPDSVTCNQPNIVLVANTTATNAAYHWHTANGNIVNGGNTLSPTVNKGGLYTLIVSLPSGCSQSITIHVPESSCIIPYYPPPTSGKSPNPTGSELGTLIDNANYSDTAGNIFRLDNGSVYIEVIAIQGQYQTLLNLLQTPSYGLTNMINNGPSTLTITGLFPIQNLQKLDSLPLLINYVRPLFPPVVNNGVSLSQGDKAMRAPFARQGYNVEGEGVKVGVLSNSYNTQPGNKANTDVLNEDLPGNGNTKNPNPVKVLQDYPYGVQSDEGRAMLQIIHDVAPKAELAFTTGFLSAGNMAQGILDLAADSCDIIVDDITFITEPFLTDGVISQTVNAVTDSGVSYFSSAGNFGEKSYASSFNPAPTPNNIVGDAHDFGGGDIFQSVTLEPGNYTIVLQWQDSVYSIGQTSTGTNNDLDIYLTDDLGNTLFGFNRNNLHNDPLEVMPFTVTQNTQSNILIVRAAGSQNVFFKYVVFQGNMIINEYQSGTSTIVGHPNAEGAMAVGAVLYSNSPEFGNTPTVASFSSRGGSPVNGVIRNKPEFCAPNGVNTTVNLGGPNIESDAFPNFFGTSAAAPHAAAVAALLKSAQAKFENHNSTPSEIKNLLSTTSIDMGAAGFDTESGAGFIQADQAMLSFANPKPEVSQVTFLDTTQTPGVDTIHVNILGNYFTPASIVLLRDDTLFTNYINSSKIEVNIPPFNGNPPIRIYNKPISSSLLDGGFSDTLLLFSPIKKTVQLVVDNKIKKYSEAIPQLTFTVLVDSIPFDAVGYSLYDLGLDSINLFTTASSTSNVGIYLIRAEMDSLDLSDPFELGLSELFNYEFIDASLTINPMPLTITAKDTTVEYGYPLGDFHFKYSFDDSLVNPAELGVFSDSIEHNHQSNLTNAVSLVTRSPARGRALVNADLLRLSFAASGRALVNARSSTRARGRALVNASIVYDTTYFVDISEESVFDYQINPDSATFFDAVARQKTQTSKARGRALVNARSVARGRALVNGYPLVNAYPLINGSPLVNAYDLVNDTDSLTDSSEMVLVFDEDDLDTTGTDSILSFSPINLITGTEVGTHAIVPGPMFSMNYDITYELGNLTITPATLILKADSITVTYGDSVVFYDSISGFQYNDIDSSVIVNTPTYTLLDSNGNAVDIIEIDAGTYTIVPDSLVLLQPVNYNVQYIFGELVVNKANLVITVNDTSRRYGKPNPMFNLSYSGFVYNDGLNDITHPTTSCLALDSSSIGVYPINLLGGNSSNYEIILIDGILTVIPANIYVTARDTFVDEGSSPPSFSYDILGDYFPMDSVLSVPNLTLSSTYNGSAGVYDISPSGLVIKRASNYLIYYTNGQLYVNPKGSGTQKIRLSLQCVDQINNDPSGYDYVAQINYSNSNSTPIYIPKGKNNVILSGGLNSNDPTEIFQPGNGSKDIYFDGSGFAWFVFSNENSGLSYSIVYANSNSQKCIVAKKSSSQIEISAEPIVYPNPVKNHFVINTSNHFDNKEIFIYDLNGKRTNENYILSKTENGNYKVDFSAARPGIYMVILQTKDERFTYKIIKE